MGTETKIQWCDHTFNPWEGCTKVSPGCAHCYAEAQNHRWGKDNWGKGKPRRRTSAANWKEPVKWNRYLTCDCGAVKVPTEDPEWREIPCPVCDSEYRRQRVFCASLADWLDDEVPIEWLGDLLKLIQETPNLDWLLLTKRPENWAMRIATANGYLALQGDIEKFDTHPHLLAAYMLADWHAGKAPDNVWIGTSVENQAMADLRVPLLLKIPSKERFLSVEPMLGAIDFRFPENFTEGNKGNEAGNGKDGRNGTNGVPDWVIFGGESGRDARPCNVEWIRSGVKQCRDAGVAPFVKQLGKSYYDHKPGHSTHVFSEDSKGGDMSEWPEDLRVRAFPSCPSANDAGREFEQKVTKGTKREEAR